MFGASLHMRTRKILSRSQSFGALDDLQLADKAKELRFRSRSGKSIQSLMPDAYALVREVSRRTLKMPHYPVQIQAGIELANKKVVEMQTGEGKTLTATLPLFLYSLRGKGALLATANDYLAARDAELMLPIYKKLGVTVGTVTAEMGDEQRYEAYRCDVTYGTITEFGFDFPA